MFDGFSGGLGEARKAMGKRLGLRRGESGRREEERLGGEIRSLPRLSEGGESGRVGSNSRVRGGPFGDNPPVIGVRTRREGGLAGERVAVGEEEAALGRVDPPLGRSSPFEFEEERRAPHLERLPASDSLSAQSNLDASSPSSSLSSQPNSSSDASISSPPSTPTSP